MADIAHDASGPSPKPGDVAPQQASRPDSPEGDELRVFVSYSRDDLRFAGQLVAALNACGFECFIDREGISGGEKWKQRIGNLISEADTVVFMLSPASARSEICAWEVEEAARLGKRILPVNCRPLEGASPPPRLRDLNYVFLYEDPKVKDSGFGTGLKTLVASLNTDFDWLREHTRYLQRATEWDSGGRPANRLLSGDDIAEAKDWAARRPKSAPEPTSLHLDFIRASEEEAEARSSAQRKQLEAMAAAQAECQKALHEAEEAQRKRATNEGNAEAMFNLGLLYANGQGVTQDYVRAREWYEKAAEKGFPSAMGNLGVLYHNGQGVAQDYVRAREWYEKAADEGNAEAMFNLGLLYANGQGVTQDYVRAREWYEKAAEKGFPRAMGNLGLLYHNDQGVAQDYAKACEWYEKAAANGNATAMLNLGQLYEEGWGVAQDYGKAREWYEKAADKGEPRAKAQLEQLPIRAADAGRYAEALQLQEALAVKVEEAETKREGNPAKETAQALQGVAWRALFAREFTKALTASDRAHELLPDDLGIETNRAHALMFVERGKESKALYLAHKGKPISEEDAKLWERAIAEDFAEFRKAGLTHPMMADIPFGER
jgi:TPR repeat protein